MNILKKRVNGTSIVLIGDKLYTRTDVSDELWIEILEQIDKVQSVCEDTDELADEMEVLMFMVDPERVKKLAKQAEIINIAIKIGDLEPLKEDRLRKAKRIADISGIFEHDDEGLVYLKGFDHVMPKIMIDAILDAHYNPSSEYTVSSLLNFWKYLLLNPDKHVREGLFQWIKSGKFAITEDGNIISYRNVDIKKHGTNQKLIDFINESWAKVKRWKKSPKNYFIYDVEDGYTLNTSIDKANSVVELGSVDELYNSGIEAGETVYEPQHKGPYGQEIIIGTPVSMPRIECDNDADSSCSRGLHCKSVNYGLNMGSEILVTLVNPYNIVAIPTHDVTKFRTCEYLPVAKAELNEYKDLVEFNNGTYDIPYNGLESLSKLLKSKSVAELQESGELSNEISITDMDIIMAEAREVISKRMIKVQ